MRRSNWAIGLFAGSLFVFSPFAYALNDVEVTDSRCTFVNKGTNSGVVNLSCPGLSETAIANIEKLLEEQLKEQTRNLRQKNDHIDLLNEQIDKLKQDREEALAENKVDQENNPDNPLLLAEKKALQEFDLQKAAELREQYYFELKNEKNEKVLALQTEMAREAFISASRWESAFNSARALSLYQEAVEYKKDYREAWRAISRMAERLGRYSLSLEAAQSLQKHLDPEKDQWWLAAAYSDEADALTALGQNNVALKKYQKMQLLLAELSEKEPDDLNRQRDLSVSHNKVGDMHLKTGDNVAALKAY